MMPDTGGYGQQGGFATPQPPTPSGAAQTQSPQSARAITVGALLPLTDPRMGEPMLNAMQMAVQDLRAENIRLIIKDSGTSAAQAQTAARFAVQQGATLLVGPIYADQVRAVKLATNGTPSIAFSTDTSVAGNGVYLLSILPTQQVDRVLIHAKGQGRQHIAVITSADAYGDLILRAASATLKTAPASLRVTNANAATAPLILPPQTDGVLLALPPAIANTVAGRLVGRNLSLYGLGLWDDPALAQARNLNNAEFSAPDPALRGRFEKAYSDLYGIAPPRLATQAYDAMALASILAMQGDGVSAATIQNRAGFNGVDGLFRLNNNGLPERGLAILRVRDGKTQTVSAAPVRFAP